MLAGVVLPNDSYDRAASSLEHAASANGDAAILAAEAAIHGGARASTKISEIKRGLALEPMSARGWILLAEAEGRHYPQRAALALSQSLVLAPYDFFLGGPRARMSAELWNVLDTDTRAMSRRQVVRLWEEGTLRNQLMPLFETEAGRELLKASFAGTPDELRALNRWASAKARSSTQP
jgi:hypothetical protein